MSKSQWPFRGWVNVEDGGLVTLDDEVVGKVNDDFKVTITAELPETLVNYVEYEVTKIIYDMD